MKPVWQRGDAKKYTSRAKTLRDAIRRIQGEKRSAKYAHMNNQVGDLYTVPSPSPLEFLLNTSQSVMKLVQRIRFILFA